MKSGFVTVNFDVAREQLSKRANDLVGIAKQGALRARTNLAGRFDHTRSATLAKMADTGIVLSNRQLEAFKRLRSKLVQ